jgi:type IV secretory pathway VirB4 component
MGMPYGKHSSRQRSHDPRLRGEVYHYDDLDSLKTHVLAFVTAYNFAKHLKALQWRTPYQVIGEAWTKNPSIFKINPRHLIPGPHT